MVGDDTPVIEAVLACDVERTQLLRVGAGEVGGWAGGWVGGRVCLGVRI